MAPAKTRHADARLRYPGMTPVTCGCHQSRGLTRLAVPMEQSKAIYRLRVEQTGPRMIAEIADSVLRLAAG